MVGARDTAWRRHRFTVAEVERMVASGVLAEDLHVELLDGDLVDVSPQGPVHAALHTELRDRLSGFAKRDVLGIDDEVDVPGLALRWRVVDLL